MVPEILEVTPHELVVLKPAGLVSELPRDPTGDSLVRRLASCGFGDLRLVHRLDAPACGLMVVARSAAAAAHYAREIAERRWRKFYVARIAGEAAERGALVGRHKAYLRTEGRRARVVRSGGKVAWLDVVSVAEAPGAPADGFVLIELLTGRFHQVRAMLAHLGAPLTGDTLYGGPPRTPLYLEHALLAARPFEQPDARVWVAPPHADRPRWPNAIAQALDERRRSLDMRNPG